MDTGVPFLSVAPFYWREAAAASQNTKYQLTNRMVMTPSPAADTATTASWTPARRPAHTADAQKSGKTARRNLGRDMKGRGANTRDSGASRLAHVYTAKEGRVRIVTQTAA